MTFEVSILGSSSATPTLQRHPTAQVLNVNERFFLIDCGEGTQMQMNRFKIKFQRINHIFISHLHGDHYLGLMGLLSTMHLQGRTNDIHIYSQAELRDIIELQLNLSETRLRYTIHYHPVQYDKSRIIFEDEEVRVETIILNHRIPCTGFLFKEQPRKRNLIKDQLTRFNIPLSAINDLKNGKDYTTEQGKVLKNQELTTAPKPSRSYAYCSDTIYDESLIPIIQNADLLYHESTFLNDMLERAVETYHTTSLQAATIAKKAGVEKLLLGHFSARYKDLEPFLTEAKTVFENTMLAMEGQRFRVGN
jgi:ribonuclease Z